MHEAAASGNVAAIELLHKAGAPLDEMSATGAPLHWAASEGAHSAVLTLLQLGALVDPKDERSLTPLILAAASAKPKSCCHLIGHGADCGAVLGGGLTLMHIFAETGQVAPIEALLATDNGSRFATIKTEAGELPVHLAANNGHLDAAKALWGCSELEAPATLEALMAAATERTAAAEASAATTKGPLATEGAELSEEKAAESKRFKVRLRGVVRQPCSTTLFDNLVGLAQPLLRPRGLRGPPLRLHGLLTLLGSLGLRLFVFSRGFLLVGIVADAREPGLQRKTLPRSTRGLLVWAGPGHEQPLVRRCCSRVVVRWQRKWS